MSSGSSRSAIRIHVTGLVQGVGYRPFIARMAAQLELFGWVRNDPRGVTIHAEGPGTLLPRFFSLLLEQHPPGAKVDGVEVEDVVAMGLGRFQIVTSEPSGETAARIPRDLALCDQCRREQLDPTNRRFGHPFIHCPDCGPRYTVLRSLPHDRHSTTMRAFSMCPRCDAEYRSIPDRRYHSELVACRACGPRAAFVGPSNAVTRGEDAIRLAAFALRENKIVAIKGIGGYQLLCRADSSEATRRVRHMKRRPTKPLAVMAASSSQAETIACFDDAEKNVLASKANPIVILRKKDGSNLVREIAPSLSTVGVMLATTPMHHLLLEDVGVPLVATSANRDDEPIIMDDKAMVGRIGELCDAVLEHDRLIARRIDDSVIQVVDNRVSTVRLGRGFAPLPLSLVEGVARRANVPPLLAVGGDQKVAVAMWNGAQAVLGPHVGDMIAPLHRRGFVSHVRELTKLLGRRPEIICHDKHPDYFTTRWAEEQGLATVAVQHHHAHAAAAIVAHDLVDREVLALTWDGTGFGEDGTVWGGEVLLANLTAFERIASLLPFPLPGGEAAIREPRRVALAMTAMSIGEERVIGDRFLLDRLGLTSREAGMLLRHARSSAEVPWSNGMGRLFDAVAVLALGADNPSYEGELAERLEDVARESVERVYPMPMVARTAFPLGDRFIPRGDWRPMIAAIAAEVRRGTNVSLVAGRFHRTLADWAARAIAVSRVNDVVVGGGCFNNRFLVHCVKEAIASCGKRLHVGGEIPLGDGGLAAGQLAVAVARVSSQVEGRPCVSACPDC